MGARELPGIQGRKRERYGIEPVSFAMKGKSVD
jgi:hypothetical protein